MHKTIGSLLAHPEEGISKAQGFPSYKNIFEKTTMSLNRSETAQKLNVSLTTLDNWRRKGCPHTKTGKQVFFNIGTLKTWLDNHSGGELDYTQERAKLTRLQAEKVTLDLEQQRGKLLKPAIKSIGESVLGVNDLVTIRTSNYLKVSDTHTLRLTVAVFYNLLCLK